MIGKVSACTATVWIATSGVAIAQVVPDNTLPVNSTVVTDGNELQITGGTLAGGNLFHSFTQFSVPTEGVVLFDNTPTVDNIISRVTGGQLSTIDGTLSANGTANLFLLNPNGIIFGNNAQLNIGGSFLGTTASGITFADGTEFNVNTSQTPLLSVNVPIGLQYGSNPAGIEVRGTQTSVELGEVLTLAGGNITIDGAALEASGGEVQLLAVSAPGTVTFFPEVSLPETIDRADITLTNATEINVMADIGGTIALHSANLNLDSGSMLIAGVVGDGGVTDAVSGNIEIDASEAVFVSEGSIIANVVDENAIGDAGNVEISTGSLQVSGESVLTSDTFGTGNAGEIFINARDRVTIDNSFLFSDAETGAIGNAGFIEINTETATIANNSEIGTRLFEGVMGQAGNITINAGSLAVTSGSTLTSDTFAVGDAGSIVLNVRDRATFDNGFVFSDVEEGAIGDSDGIFITAGSLAILNQSELSTNVDSQGIGGEIIFNVASDVVLDNSFLFGDVEEGANGIAGFIEINAESIAISNGSALGTRLLANATGEAGAIAINTGTLDLSGGSALTSDTFGMGNAGAIVINARDRVNFNSSFAFSDAEMGAIGDAGFIEINTEAATIANNSEIGTRLFPNVIGEAGNITVNADFLNVISGSSLSSDTFGEGNSGAIVLNVRDTIVFDNGSALSDVEAGAMGDSDTIDITAENLFVLNRSDISTNVEGDGIGGAIVLNIGDRIVVDNSEIRGDVEEGGFGDGDRIIITARSLQLQNDAEISTNVEGVGNGGEVIINLSGDLRVDASEILADLEADAIGSAGFININADTVTLVNDALISTRVLPNATGNAGDIDLSARSVFVTGGSDIDGTTQGFGNAGGVGLIASDRIVFDGGNSLSEAFPGSEGNGGGVELIAPLVIIENGAIVGANNLGDTDSSAGEVSIIAPRLRLNNNAIVTASTVGLQGDIDIQSRDFRLRRGSRLNANATGTEPGGNITIVTDTVVALENSDITANAINSRGGNIGITALGIFGTEFRPFLTPNSDITASSALGPQFSGQVELLTPDVDAAAGLVDLDVDVIDATALVGQNPCNSSTDSEFIVTGRGGLPPNPTDTVFVPGSAIEWDNGGDDGAIETNPNQPPQLTPLSEATHWTIAPNGRVSLVSQVPVTPFVTPETCKFNE